MQNTRVELGRGSDEQRLEPAAQLLYAAASVGTGAFYAFNNFVLPPVLKTLGAPDVVIGLLSSTRSIEGAVIQPAVGAMSDRIWTRAGRRRPFMLLGVPLCAAFFLAAAFLRDLAAVALMIVLFSIFFNVAVDPYTALLADITPLDQRGWVSGLATGVQLISSVLLLLLIAVASAGGNGVPSWTYVAVAVTLVASFAITLAGLDEPARVRRAAAGLDEPVSTGHPLAGVHQPVRVRHALALSREPVPVGHPARPGLRTSLEVLLEQRQALRYLGTLFVYQFGLNAILPYLVLFVVDDIGQTEQVAFTLSAVLLVVTALAAAACGRLADRLGMRRVLAFGWLLLAASACAGVFVSTVQQTVAVVLVAGLGNGAATAVSWPLLTALIPHDKTGVFAGLKAAAESIATPLSVVVAAEVFLPWLGYRGIFAMLAVAITLALVLLLCFVHAPRSGDRCR